MSASRVHFSCILIVTALLKGAMLIVSLEVSETHSGANRKTYLIIVFLDDWNDCIWYKNVVNNDVKQSNTNNYWLTVWIICVGWPTISATIAFMFCKVFNDAALSPRHLVCQSMTSVRHNHGNWSPPLFWCDTWYCQCTYNAIVAQNYFDETAAVAQNYFNMATVCLYWTFMSLLL